MDVDIKPITLYSGSGDHASDLLKQSNRLSDLVPQHSPVILPAFTKEVHSPLTQDKADGIVPTTPPIESNSNSKSLEAGSVTKEPAIKIQEDEITGTPNTKHYKQYTNNFEHSLQT